MKMKRSPFWILAAIVALVAATAILRTFTQPASQAAAQDEEQQAEGGGPPASPLNGPKTVALSPDAQARIGVRVATLAAMSAQKRITAAAIVLSAQDLVGMRNAYAAAQATVEKAQVNLGVTQKEYARLQTLYQDNQNVSQKELQSAEAARGSDAIDLRSARQQLALEASLVRQKWGSVVTKWVEDPSPALDGVLAQSEMFVEVSLADGQAIRAPSTVWLTLPNGEERRATYVSPLPQVDPRIQGTSLLYSTPAAPGLAPGLTLIAQLPVGRRMRGVVVPASAVVWSDGVAWIYAQTAPGRFARRPLATDFPMNNGYFVVKGFSAGERVVISGAQLLLSEELSPPPSASSEEDEDD
jgi:hypothetical protein